MQSREVLLLLLLLLLLQYHESLMHVTGTNPKYIEIIFSLSIQCVIQRRQASFKEKLVKGGYDDEDGDEHSEHR